MIRRIRVTVGKSSWVYLSVNAGFYIVRKNFSMAIPELAQFGFEKGELSIVLSMNAVAYALSKFLMGSVSDRSNARVFLPLGLVLAAVSMMFMIVPVQFFGPEQKSLAIIVMAVLNFLVGWFNGMGWPPCGRVMTHWFSVDRTRNDDCPSGTVAHNVGGSIGRPDGSLRCVMVRFLVLMVPTHPVTSSSVRMYSRQRWLFL